jgi:hypothetical protein
MMMMRTATTVLALVLLASASALPAPGAAAGNTAAAGRRSLLDDATASCNGFCAHFFSFAAGSSVADVGAAPHDDVAAAWTVAFADTTTGAPTERALPVSGGDGTAAGQHATHAALHPV